MKNLRDYENYLVRWRNWLDANKVRSQLECRNTFMYPKMISYRFESCPDYKKYKYEK